jgi:hypothetical protein
LELNEGVAKYPDDTPKRDYRVLNVPQETKDHIAEIKAAQNGDFEEVLAAKRLELFKATKAKVNRLMPLLKRQLYLYDDNEDKPATIIHAIKMALDEHFARKKEYDESVPLTGGIIKLQKMVLNKVYFPSLEQNEIFEHIRTLVNMFDSMNSGTIATSSHTDESSPSQEKDDVAWMHRAAVAIQQYYGGHGHIHAILERMNNAKKG